MQPLPSATRGRSAQTGDTGRPGTRPGQGALLPPRLLSGCRRGVLVRPALCTLPARAASLTHAARCPHPLRVWSFGWHSDSFVFKDPFFPLLSAQTCFLSDVRKGVKRREHPCPLVPRSRRPWSGRGARTFSSWGPASPAGGRLSQVSSRTSHDCDFPISSPFSYKNVFPTKLISEDDAQGSACGSLCAGRLHPGVAL